MQSDITSQRISFDHWTLKTQLPTILGNLTLSYFLTTREISRTGWNCNGWSPLHWRGLWPGPRWRLQGKADCLRATCKYSGDQKSQCHGPFWSKHLKSKYFRLDFEKFWTKVKNKVTVKNYFALAVFILAFFQFTYNRDVIQSTNVNITLWIPSNVTITLCLYCVPVSLAGL